MDGYSHCFVLFFFLFFGGLGGAGIRTLYIFLFLFFIMFFPSHFGLPSFVKKKKKNSRTLSFSLTRIHTLFYIYKFRAIGMYLDGLCTNTA